MESCLRGSKRKTNNSSSISSSNNNYNNTNNNNNNNSHTNTIPNRHQRGDFYIREQIEEQELQELRHYQHQQQQEQQHLNLQVLGGTKTATTIRANPKFVNNCLQFPPPPNYPPPIKASIAANSNHKMAGRNTKTPISANNMQQQLQQQQQQQSHMPVLHQHHIHLQQQAQQQPTPAAHMNLHLQQHVQSTINTLQQQINNLHLEMDSSRDPRVMNMSNQHHQQHHAITALNSSRSPTSSSSSTSISMNSGNTIGISPCSRRGHVLPRYPDPDPDAIEICNEGPKETTVSGNLTRRQQQREQREHRERQLALEAESMHWPPTPHSSHDYSYAYYEPGVAMRHSNIPPAISPSLSPLGQTPPPPPPNSMRALLSKGKKNKSLVSAATRHCYQTRYGMRNADCTALHTLPANMLLMHENFYEEISSATEARAPLRGTAANSHSAGSLNQSLVEEELRRVQTRHRKILGELNLSVEAMLMPESPPPSAVLVGDECSGSGASGNVKEKPTVSVTASSGQPVMVGGVRLSATSADNICASSQMSEEMHNNSQLGFCAADLDSGFSGSSGASYIGSLRIHKTNAALSQLKQEKRQVQATSGIAANSNLCPFPYATQSCRSFQRGAITTTRLTQDDDADNDVGFLTRASCGRRILNCAKLRANEDPGPNAANRGGGGDAAGAAAAAAAAAIVVPTESKAKSFWNRKGWRKLPGFSTSTSSINDTGLTGTFKRTLRIFK